MRQMGRWVMRILPSYNQILYEFCKKYVDRFNGDNNSLPEVNGEYAFLRKYLNGIDSSGTIFDIGANVGDWTRVVLKIHTSIQVHCFEPSRMTYSKLVSGGGGRKMFT